MPSRHCAVAPAGVCPMRGAAWVLRGADIGGGVVYDSVPADEYEETVNKARAMLKAIEIAETQLS